MVRLTIVVLGLCVLCVLCVCTKANETCGSGSDVCPAPSGGGSGGTTTKKPELLSRLGGAVIGGLKAMIVPGANGVPLGYVTDMAMALAPDFSWLKIFCGVTTMGCDKPNSWPGPNTVGVAGYQKAKEAIAAMPRNEWSGKWWRGNELGTLINNPYFYSLRDKGANETWLSPMAIALGITPKQHAAVRPVFEKALIKRGASAEVYQEFIDRTAEELLENAIKKGRIEHQDLKVWFQKVVNKFSFDREVSQEYAEEFVDLQGKFLAGQLRSQIVPKFLYALDPMGLKPVLETVRKFVTEFEVLVREKYGDLLKDQDCSPSRDCYIQAAFAMLDAHLAAGGVSVPGTILQALSVVYSTDPTNPAGEALEDYTSEEALQLHWEAIRIFPPVVVFPYWSPRPTCPGLSAKETADLNAPNGETKPCPHGKADRSTGYPAVNQYKGGTRHLPNVAMAQLDADIWGADPYSFRLRNLRLYDKYSQGFVEAAEDPTVADGRMNRSCPGRGLSLIMGKAFLSRFRPKEWVVNPDIPIKIKTGGPYVADFVMYRKEAMDKCHKDKCSCDDSSKPDCKCPECY